MGSGLPLEKWEFRLDPVRWDINGDSKSFNDDDRRQWKQRLPGYLLADHLTAEPAFLAMVDRVRRAEDTADAAWQEAHYFSPRGGGKGGRRELMATLLRSAAGAEPGGEERAILARLPGAWTSPEKQSGRRAAYQSRADYIARLWIGVRVLVCRSAGHCVECEVSSRTSTPVVRGDYCGAHLADTDHKDLNKDERVRRAQLRSSKSRHRKAVEHLFLDLAAVLPPAR